MINTVVKIVTKILSTRLQPHLKTLVMSNQTAFIKGRSLMESFLVTREWLTFCSKQKLPAVLYKVDLEKAFDTVDWSFMINLLIERGFPLKWLAAILGIMHSSTSAVRVTGSITRYFSHRRGLRQGDPLSPMLFILVADSLNRFLSNAASEMGPKVFLPTKAIQFADDTVIILEAHPTTLKVITHILKLYESLSGLKINRTKSAFLLIAVKLRMVQIIYSILTAPEAQLPLKYLGLPLTIRKPCKIHYQNMIMAVQGRIEG